MLYKGKSEYGEKSFPTAPHFKVKEIRCHDLNVEEYLINDAVLKGLEKLRAIIGKPIIVTSGYRSPEYNARVGGVYNSQHVQGNAIDFHVTGMTTQEIYNIIKENNMLGTDFKGIGLYDDFLHCDFRKKPHKRGYSFWDSRK